MKPTATLLLIGVHREELAFGRGVAALLDAGSVALLEIPEGLSGRRPLPDEEFRYHTLHRALYRQVLDHMRRGGYRLLLDLHAGRDPAGPSADLISRDTALLARLDAAIAADAALAAVPIRTLPLGGDASPRARTVIPNTLWANPRFAYVGIEIYLPDAPAAQDAACRLGAHLLRLAINAAEGGAAEPGRDAPPGTYSQQP